MEIGGGFGAKAIAYLDPVAAVLSKKTGRPVKISMDRKEVFEGSGPTSATFMRCKMGVKNDGTMVAGELYMIYEAGAYPGSPVGGGALTGFGPYKMEHMQVDGLDVVCNKQKVQAYRAPGQPQAAFAVEPVVDELADLLGMDPMELRLKNAVQEGDRMPNGVPHRVFGCREMEEAMIKLRPQPDSVDRSQPGPRSCGRVPLAGRSGVVRHHQRQRRRHAEPDHRLGGHRWDADGGGHAGGRDAGHRRGRDRAHRRGYRYGGLDGHHRRQPYRLRHRPGRHLRLRGPARPDGRAVRHGVGGGTRPGPVRRRRVHLQQQRRTHDHRRRCQPHDAYRRPADRVGIGHVHGRRPGVRRQHHRRSSRSGDGQGGHPALYRVHRRRHRGPSQLRGRPDAGRARCRAWAGRCPRITTTPRMAGCSTPASWTTGCPRRWTCR